MTGGGERWTLALVAGGTLVAGLLAGATVGVFLWIGDPLRFAGVEAAVWVVRGALCVSWVGLCLALPRWLEQSFAEGAGPVRGRVLAAAAPLGALAFALPLPGSAWMVALAVGVVSGLGALALLSGFAARRAAVARIGLPERVEGLLVGRRPQRRAVRGILVVVGLALTTVAAARPQLHVGTRLLSRRGIDIVVALDFSKSMLARDVPPSRIELAKRELESFIESLSGDRVGLVAFAGEAVQFPLTTDYEAATLFWRDLHPYDMPVGGTAIGRALNAALGLFESDQLSRDRSKVVVLLTDGEDHEGDPLEVAREAKRRGVQVHVLGIGGESPELIPEQGADGNWSGFQRDRDGQYVTTRMSAASEGQLRGLAEATGGTYFRAAPGQVGVERIHEEIRRLRQTQLAERRVRLYDEAYQYFLLFGILALVTGSVLPRGRREGEGQEEGGP